MRNVPNGQRRESGKLSTLNDVAFEKTVLSSLYPERRFSEVYREDSKLLFFSIVSDLIDANSTVLDLGAGRGQVVESARGYMRWLIDLRGRCKKLIGADIDPVVLTNPYVDEAIVMHPSGSISLPDNSVDCIACFAVLEHIADPASFAVEVERVLRPGGWLCGWTPNKWGYVGLSARMVPNRFHAKVAKRALPGDTREENDVFPTVYRLNTVGAIGRYFPSSRNFSFTANTSPSYHFGSVLLARFWKLVMFFSPPFMRKSLFVFVQAS